MSWTVYRLFDADDRLLYVGATTDPERRLGQHRRDKPWANEIRRIETEVFETEGEMADRECEAIMAEDPLHNAGVRRYHVRPPSISADLLAKAQPLADNARALMAHVEAARRRRAEVGRQVDTALYELAAATSIAEAARRVGLSRTNTSKRVYRHGRRVSA